MFYHVAFEESSYRFINPLYEDETCLDGGNIISLCEKDNGVDEIDLSVLSIFDNFDHDCGVKSNRDQHNAYNLECIFHNDGCLGIDQEDVCTLAQDGLYEGGSIMSMLTRWE